MYLFIVAAMLALGYLPPICDDYTVTAYAASDYPGLTADQSTTTTGAIRRGEPIAAASYNIRFDSYVDVDGAGVYRVADRGHLEYRHIDILMPTRSEALEFGRSTRRVCVYPPMREWKNEQ